MFTDITLSMLLSHKILGRERLINCENVNYVGFVDTAFLLIGIIS